MARVSPILTNFTAGEMSPRLYGRVDIAKYGNACRTMRNFIPLVHGPAVRRPGTYLIAETKTSAKYSRLIPFTFSTTQSYMLEFGDTYMRVYKDEAQIVDASGNPVEISTPYAHTDLSGIKYVQDADTLYLVHSGYPTYKVTRTSHTSWTISEVAFVDGPYLDENTEEDVGANLCTDGDCELDSGWSAVGSPTTRERSSDRAYKGGYSRKFIIDAAGEGDKWGTFTTTTGKVYRARFRVYTSTGNVRLAVRKGDNSGYIVEKSFSGVPSNEWTEYNVYYKETAGGSGAFAEFTAATGSSGTWYIDSIEIYEVDTTILTPSGKTGTITLTSSSSIFNSDHVGSFWRLKYVDSDGDAVWGYVQVTAYTSGTQVTATVKKELIDTAATSSWREGAFGAYRGYPSAITFHDQALWLGGTSSEPLGVWRSVPGDYENFAPGTTASDGLFFRIKAEAVNVIRWMASADDLIIGTVSGEWALKPLSSTDPLKADNVKIAAQSNNGSADIQAINFQSSLLYIQRLGLPSNPGTKVFQTAYQLTRERYISTDISLLSEHITKTGLKGWCYQATPYPIIWGWKTNGEMVSLTYAPDQEVNGWARHDTRGYVESMAVIPGTLQDDVWMIVKRTINGSDKRFVEMMMPFEFGGDESKEQAFFLDCALQYDGSPATTITGLDHLIGETVSILADGATVPDQIVSAGGSITLSNAASVVNVGLNYFSDLEPMDLEGGALEGTAQGKKKRIHELAVMFYETSGGKYGPSSSDLMEITTRTTEDRMGYASSLFSGVTDPIPFNGGFTKTGRIFIRQDKPLPMTVCAIMPRFTTEDR